MSTGARVWRLLAVLAVLGGAVSCGGDDAGEAEESAENAGDVGGSVELSLETSAQSREELSEEEAALLAEIRGGVGRGS